MYLFFVFLERDTRGFFRAGEYTIILTIMLPSNQNFYREVGKVKEGTAKILSCTYFTSSTSRLDFSPIYHSFCVISFG
jgi:hypothetical protein